MGNLIPVLQSLENAHAYVDMCEGHDDVSARELATSDAILGQIETELDRVITAPLPQNASILRSCTASVLANIELLRSRIAEEERKELKLGETLRLRVAECGLAALKFQLSLLTSAVQASAFDDEEWIH